MKNFEATVGILYIPALKNAVSKCKFLGHNVDVWIGNGILQREIIVRGDDVAVDAILDWLKRVSTERQTA